MLEIAVKKTNEIAALHISRNTVYWWFLMRLKFSISSTVKSNRTLVVNYYFVYYCNSTVYNGWRVHDFRFVFSISVALCIIKRNTERKPTVFFSRTIPWNPCPDGRSAHPRPLPFTSGVFHHARTAANRESFVRRTYCVIGEARR